MRVADRALAALRTVTHEQLVVANDPAARGWFPSTRIASDTATGLGPLAGIETALAAAGDRPILLLAWDMPFVPGELLGAMLERATDGVPAVVPEHGEARQVQPLCAFYAPRTLAACRALLAGGERRAAALVRSLADAVYLRDDELARFGDPRRIFLSVDTPEQLAAVGGALP